MITMLIITLQSDIIVISFISWFLSSFPFTWNAVHVETAMKIQLVWCVSAQSLVEEELKTKKHGVFWNLRPTKPRALLRKLAS